MAPPVRPGPPARTVPTALLVRPALRAPTVLPALPGLMVLRVRPALPGLLTFTVPPIKRPRLMGMSLSSRIRLRLLRLW